MGKENIREYMKFKIFIGKPLLKIDWTFGQNLVGWTSQQENKRSLLFLLDLKKVTMLHTFSPKIAYCHTHIHLTWVQKKKHLGVNFSVTPTFKKKWGQIVSFHSKRGEIRVYDLKENLSKVLCPLYLRNLFQTIQLCSYLS